MVYITPHATSSTSRTYETAYKSILASRRRSPSTSAASVVLLVPPDVDALCATRMLSQLFKQDDVPFRIIPVSGYAGLKEKHDELLLHTELSTLIMINMGGVLELPSSEWFADFDPQIAIHVIDSSRPHNLANLFSTVPVAQRVVVWDDGSAETLLKQHDAFEALHLSADEENESSSGSEDNDYLSESDSGEDRNPPSSQDGTPHEDTRQTEKRRRRGAHDSAAAEERSKNRAIIDKYYQSGSWRGQSAAGAIYVLATLLERTDNDLLWLSIVGLTNQFIASQISREKYDGYHGIFLDEVVRLNPPDAMEATALNPDKFIIKTSDELRFSLFRHWNLYDSMYHSSYVANKLGIWEEKGRKKLQGLLAKMGLSLEQCQQTFQHMDMDLKRQLRNQMDTIAPEYGLVDLSYPSFVRSFGFRTQPLCAADVVESVSALVQAAGGIRIEVETVGTQGGGEWFGGARIWDISRESSAEFNGATTERWKSGKGLSSNQEIVNEDEVTSADSPSASDNWWVKNFWAAFDALGTDISRIHNALPLSMALQKAITRQGSSLIDKHAIRSFRTFRYAAIKEGPDAAIFCHSGTLSRLGLWLAGALRDRQGGAARQGRKSQLPFVIACLDEPGQQCLIVGVASTTDSGDVRKNPFSRAFVTAAEEVSASPRFGTFETNVVSIDKNSLTEFLEALQLVL